MDVFYTYLWLREDGTPYYVGKGKGYRASRRQGHTCLPPADKDRILIQEFPNEASAFEAEVFLILLYGRIDLGTGCLRNLTCGGEGASGSTHSTETRRKMSAIAKTIPRRPASEETRSRMSATHLRRTRKPFSLQAILNIRASNALKKGKKTPPCSIETRSKISGRMKGRKFSAETIRKMTASAKRRCIREGRKLRGKETV